VSLVVDASATLGWYFEDEVTEAGDALMDRVRREGAQVPLLWRYEVANGLHMAIRRKRVTAAYRDAALADLRLLPIAVERSDGEEIWSAIVGLSDRFGLTVYDAAYLELAYRRGLPLATGDRELIAAAEALAVEVIHTGG
jgi:predicted nucleic acid-binding protein